MMKCMSGLMVYYTLDDCPIDSHQSFLTNMDPWITPPCIMGGQKVCFFSRDNTEFFLFSLIEVLIFLHRFPDRYGQIRRRRRRRYFLYFQNLVHPRSNLGQEALVYLLVGHHLNLRAHSTTHLLLSRAWGPI